MGFSRCQLGYMDQLHSEDHNVLCLCEPWLHISYLCPHQNAVKLDIFFLELITILSAIHHAVSFPSPPHHLLLWTDSLDVVYVLNSLHTSKNIHNAPLLGIEEVILILELICMCDKLMENLNVHADMLSQLLLDDYHSQFPADHVHFFTPPQELFMAQWRECF